MFMTFSLDQVCFSWLQMYLKSFIENYFFAELLSE